MAEGLEELLVKLVAEKEGVSEESARALLSPILAKKDKVRELADLLDKLGGAASLVEKLPEPLRSAAGPALASVVLEDDGGISMKDIKRMVEKAAVVREVMRMIGGGDGDEVARVVAGAVGQLREEVAKLREELEKLKEGREGERLEALARSLAEQLAARLAPLEERVRQLEERVAVPAQGVGQGVGQGVKELVQEVKALKEAVAELASAAPELVGKRSEEADVANLLKELEERAKRRAMEASKLEEKRIEMVGRLLERVIDELGSRITDVIGEVMREELRERVRQVRQQRQVAGGAAEGGGGGGEGERGGA